MADITCSNCDFIFPAQQRAVSQILRCPKCRECVTVSAVVSGEETELLSNPTSQKSAWKWRDIIIGFLFPVLIFGLMYLLRFVGFGVTPLIGILWIIVSVASFLAVALWMYRKRMGSWPFKPVTLKCFVKESLWAFLYVLLYFLIFFLLELSLKTLFGFEDPSNYLGRYDVFGFNNAVYIAVLVCVFTVVPFYEEVYFRGFLYPALKSRVHWIIAGICQALFFAVLHRYNWFGFIATFLIGLMLMFIYEHRKRLLTPILAHAQINFLCCLVVFGLFVMNHHIPAQTWEEANIKPEWLYDEPPEYVEQMDSGEEQRLYAIETWGSQGCRLWKKEANVFNSILIWFPEDKGACAKAKLGMVSIYFFHLNDYRRAIVEADDLLTNFVTDRETCASAWLYKAYSYEALHEYENSRESAEVVLSDYNDCEYERYAAEGLLESLPAE